MKIATCNTCNRIPTVKETYTKTILGNFLPAAQMECDCQAWAKWSDEDMAIIMWNNLQAKGE
jgi:hypothetical protein